MRSGDMITSLLSDAGFTNDVDLSEVRDDQKPKLLVAACASMIVDMLWIVSNHNVEAATSGIEALSLDMKNILLKKIQAQGPETLQ